MNYCEICGEDALVGVGAPIHWLCPDHFNAWLAEKRKIVDRLKGLPHGRGRHVDEERLP